MVGERGGVHCGGELGLAGTYSVGRGDRGARAVVQWREEGQKGVLAWPREPARLRALASERWPFRRGERELGRRRGALLGSLACGGAVLRQRDGRQPLGVRGRESRRGRREVGLGLGLPKIWGDLVSP